MSHRPSHCSVAILSTDSCLAGAKLATELPLLVWIGSITRPHVQIATLDTSGWRIQADASPILDQACACIVCPTLTLTLHIASQHLNARATVLSGRIKADAKRVLDLSCAEVVHPDLILVVSLIIA